MYSKRKILAAFCAALVIGVAPPASAAPPAGAAATRDPGAVAHTVTLVTGDRVTILSSKEDRPVVRPGKGREGMRFSVYRDRGALMVVPHDAQRLVQAGRLDRRLFDVIGLVRAGYQDGARDSLPLIVADPAGPAAAARSLPSGMSAKRVLPAIGAAAMEASKAKAGALWDEVRRRAGAGRVWLDGQRSVQLDRSVPQIGAPAAWQAGFTGRGVSVAVLDSGIDTGHPDLAGKVADQRNFTDEADGDEVGHGTHVASTIAGSGAASGGRYRGVAPDATLLSGKVCGLRGCAESAMIAGMTWAAAEKHAAVVNMSLGGGDGPDIDPVEEALNTLSAEYGTLFVVSAGNAGMDGSVASPASADAALAVGAVDQDERLAGFSSRGPRVGDTGMKPDISAPGVGIVAAGAGTGGYVGMSGTSMAAPHVTGAAALLAQQHPEWTAERLKGTLTASAQASAEISGFAQGAGRVDVARAITQTVTAVPVGVSFGRTLWPHNDDEPVARTITYHNDGPADRVLDLHIQALGPENRPAPQGMFQLAADRITVPAHGSAQVTVTADTNGDGPDGLYSGQVLATDGATGTSVSTAIGVEREMESFDVRVSFVDGAGAPTSDNFSSSSRSTPTTCSRRRSLAIRSPFVSRAAATTTPRWSVRPLPTAATTAHCTYRRCWT
ncbi:S8 family serine peptidase [Phytohabitans flavus]